MVYLYLYFFAGPSKRGLGVGVEGTKCRNRTELCERRPVHKSPPGVTNETSYRATRRDMPPRRRSRRIYVRARTDPQSAQLWWPGIGAARLAGPGGTDRRTDRQTDGRIAAGGHNKTTK